MPAPLNLPPLRAVIAEHGLRADKRFGQHYLLDLNLTAKIARAAGDLTDTAVLEVGPGPGGLTRALLEAGAGLVVAVEADSRFLPALEALSAAAPGRLRVHHGDALKVDAPALLNAHAPDARRRAIVSNLPYNVGTALLIQWLSAEPPGWDHAVLMFQKEVAERITAKPGAPAYGRLAVLTAARARAHLAFTVPARAFTPPPKVDSAVVVLDPLEDGARFKDVEALGAVTAAAFGQRRKTLRKSLSAIAGQAGLAVEDWLAGAGIDPGARPETLPPEAFQRLAAPWRASRTSTASPSESPRASSKTIK